MTIQTYNARRGRMRGGRLEVLDRLWPAYGVPAAGPLDPLALFAPLAPLDPLALFGRDAPLVLEIGSGMGDAIAYLAAADPARDYLAVEVHTAGVANLLTLIGARGLTNIRIAHGDAVALVRDRLAPGSVDAVHIFFPDPWPKSRHQKRRLVQAAHVALLRSRLAPGGVLRCATDSAGYAASMLDTLTNDGGLANSYPGYAPRPSCRPITKYEQRALDAGRPVFDLVFRRPGGAP